jgi:ABC-2 type transport system ATP-binding protein
MYRAATGRSVLAMNSSSDVPAGSPAVYTQGLCKRFGSRVALDGVDLEVPSGCAFGVIGPNGAGKTTLIRLLLGLAEPSAGRVRVLGRDLPTERPEALARVGAIIEEPSFCAHLTGRENLEVYAAARCRAARGRIDESLERLGLAARAGDKVRTYSLGMRQRLGVARCLLADPQLLILDEPMNGLDPAGMLEFRGLIRELVAEGRSVLLSSHLLDEVEKVCDFAAIVDDGRVVARGSIAELLGGGRRVLEIGGDPTAEAHILLARMPEVASVEERDGRLLVALTPDASPNRELVPRVLRRLLAGGIAVVSVVPVATSLEQRFLSMTTPLEERS